VDTGTTVLSSIDLGAMNAYIALLAVVINVTLALLALTRTSRKTIYVTFALVCLSVAWWNFWDFLVYATGNPVWNPVGIGTNTPWKNNVSIGSALAAAALFHFTMAIVDRLRRNRSLIIAAYALAIPIGLIPQLAPYNKAIHQFWVGPGWNFSYFIFLFPFLAASIITVAGAYHRSRGKDEAGWLLFILLAMVIQVGTGMTDLFHKLQPALPPLGHLGSAVGPLILAIGVLRHRKTFDILAQAQEKLELISSMAAEVAHEIRNPLTAMKGVAQLQADMDRDMDIEKIRQYQGIMLEEIERVEDILRSLQDLTKPMKMMKERIDINKVLGKTIQFMDPENTGLEITYKPDLELPEITADPSLLKQVFLNLIRNASESCGGQGTLNIRTYSDKNSIGIDFTDDGPGVPEEILARIFDPFFTTKESGFGLGLMVVNRIVDAHSGRICIENVQSGGAKVTILISR